MSSELEGVQERPRRGDLSRGVRLGEIRLGGVRLGDLLRVDLFVWLGDLTLTECHGDLDRDWRGLLPLLLRVAEGDRRCCVRGRVHSRSVRRQFCSSINDVCR